MILGENFNPISQPSSVFSNWVDDLSKLIEKNLFYLFKAAGILVLWIYDSMWPDGAISWHHLLRKFLLMAPCNYLYQCWLTIAEVIWHILISNLCLNLHLWKNSRIPWGRISLRSFHITKVRHISLISHYNLITVAKAFRRLCIDTEIDITIQKSLWFINIGILQLYLTLFPCVSIPLIEFRELNFLIHLHYPCHHEPTSHAQCDPVA